MSNYMTVDQAAVDKGIHRNTIYNLIKAGNLPVKKIGKRILILNGDVARIEVMDTGTPKPFVYVDDTMEPAGIDPSKVERLGKCEICEVPIFGNEGDPDPDPMRCSEHQEDDE